MGRSESEFRSKDLYGGAIHCTLPSEFQDVSTFRQVPDHQEVFADEITDRCIIIEILQYETSVSRHDSAEYFFKELSNSNSSSSGETMILHQETIDSKRMSLLPQECAKEALLGLQQVAKFREDVKNKVLIYLCNIRLPNVESDIIISMTVPIKIHPESSSSKACFEQHNQDMEGADTFQKILASFKISNWGLFQG